MLGEVYEVALYYDPYDPPPRLLTREQMGEPSYSGAYGLGEVVGYILESSYLVEGAAYVHASRWVVDDGFFSIVADIKPLMTQEEGIYTVVIFVEVEGEYIPLTCYLIPIGSADFVFNLMPRVGTRLNEVEVEPAEAALAAEKLLATENY